jgi:hypothetical protein
MGDPPSAIGHRGSGHRLSIEPPAIARGQNPSRASAMSQEPGAPHKMFPCLQQMA